MFLLNNLYALLKSEISRYGVVGWSNRMPSIFFLFCSYQFKRYSITFSELVLPLLRFFGLSPGDKIFSFFPILWIFSWSDERIISFTNLNFLANLIVASTKEVLLKSICKFLFLSLFEPFLARIKATIFFFSFKISLTKNLNSKF